MAYCLFSILHAILASTEFCHLISTISRRNGMSVCVHTCPPVLPHFIPIHVCTYGVSMLVQVHGLFIHIHTLHDNTFWHFWVPGVFTSNPARHHKLSRLSKFKNAHPNLSFHGQKLRHMQFSHHFHRSFRALKQFLLPPHQLF